MKVVAAGQLRALAVAWLLALLAFGACAQPASDLPFNTVQPFVQLKPLTFDASQQAWLKQHPVLRVGITLSDHEPVDITGDSNRYQGVSADYLGLVGSRLGVALQVIGYARRAEALQALLDGEVDVLTSASGFERTTPGVVFSAEYMPDRSVVVRRGGESRLELAGEKVVLVEGYADLAAVHQAYPDSQVILAPTLGSALQALREGNVDGLISNEIIVRSYNALRPYIALEIAGTSALPPTGYAFASRGADTRLHQLLDQALASIDESLRREILGRWTTGLGSDIAQNRIELTPAEQAWVKDHRQVRVTASQYSPYLYQDRQGQWVGLNSEVLATISRMTGLQFTYLPTRSIAQGLDILRRGDADMSTTLSETVERKAFLNFSHSFGGQGWVFIVRSEDMPLGALDDLAGRTLALPAEHALESSIREDYPHITLRLVKNFEEARELVIRGEADATIDSEVGAYRAVGRYPAGVLKVGRSVEGKWSPDRFAVSVNQPHLLSILNKALEAYPVAELRGARLKWLGAVVPPEPVWQRYALWVYWAIGAAMLFGLASLLWSGRLKAQIRQREQAEEALNDQLAFKRALLDGIPSPIYVRDLDGRLVTCNKSYEKSFSTQLEQVQGRTLLEVDVLSPDKASLLHRDYLQLLADQQPVSADRQIEMFGRKVEAWQWMVPFYRADGQMQGLLGGWIDITERKRLEQALVEARQAAELANKAKSAFLATMSHEIRNPLAAVVGLLELERETAHARGQQPSQAVEVAFQSAKGLIALVGDTLDLAKIEAGSLRVVPEPTALAPLFQAVVDLFSVQAQNKGLALLLEVGEGLEGDVMLDPLRLRQVLHNLLSNSIKATAQGSIRLGVRLLEETAQGLRLRIQVQDNGIGISADQQARLFKPFVQVADSQAGELPGAGLGLSICRQLVELMGGSIALHSELGAGTCVTVELVVARAPIAAPKTAAGPEGEQPAVSPLKVLVVDDLSANRLVLSQQLAFLGHEVTALESGDRALALLRQETFDVLFTDCNMPGMSGFALAQAVRQREAELSLAPLAIIGCTADATGQERQRGEQAGMDEWLVKPASLGELTEAIARVIAGAAFEISALHRLTQANPTVVRQMLQELSSNLAQEHHGMATAVAAQDWAGIGQALHRLKGIACLINAVPLAQACARLSACKAAPTALGLEQCWVVLESALQQLRAEIDARLATNG